MMRGHPWVAPGEPGRTEYLREKRAEGCRVVATSRRLGLIDETVPAPHRWVLDARYPTDGARPTATLRELAIELGVSAERIRQIENGEIRRLRYALDGWSRREVGLGVARCPCVAMEDRHP